MTVHALLDHLLTADPSPAPIADVDAWWARVQDLPFEESGARAAAGGFAADRLGWAFASGYQAALRRLVPGLDGKVALCATEAEGNRPRHIETRLEDGRVTGTKSFVTLGTAADRLLVVATDGVDAAGRNRLKVVVVSADAPGVTVRAQPELPFVPEIDHATLVLEGAPGEVLPGDGYADYVKPFRTVEDLHVHAALYGWLIQIGRRAGWADELLEGAFTLLTATVGLCGADPSSVGVHRALGGILDGTLDLLEATEPAWAAVDEETRGRWARDQPLLRVAGSARAARLAKARGVGS